VGNENKSRRGRVEYRRIEVEYLVNRSLKGLVAFLFTM